MRAIKGAGTDESLLIELFASRSNHQIKALCDAYLSETGRSLNHDLKSEVSGDFEKTLLTLAEVQSNPFSFCGLNGKRDETSTVDAAKAKEDAKILYEAGEKKWGTDESKFIDILCHRSVPQLRQTLVEYKSLSGRTLQESIEREMSGRLEDILVAIGTTESTLRRIIVSRSELDLQDIKAEYKKLYGCSLYSAI
ncbi:hypothetical protein DNTS_028423, partial [Danionella cerebrum]